MGVLYELRLFGKGISGKSGMPQHASSELSVHILFVFIYACKYVGVRMCTCIYVGAYTWNPNDPCLGWERPSFGSKTKDRWVPGMQMNIAI